MKKKVLVLLRMLHPDGERLLAQETNLCLLEKPTMERVMKEAPDTNIILTRLPWRVTREMIEAAPNLELISASGAGLDSIDLEAATGRGIPVVYAPGVGSLPVVEHAITLMLCVAKKILTLDSAYRRGQLNWDSRTTLTGTELAGKTLGVVGLGHIGSELARRCLNCFDMRAISYSPHIPRERAQELGVLMMDDLDDLLRESDYVAICTRLTSETRKLIGRRELGLMKKTAYLINIARGPLVDEPALVEALQEERIAGAGLDCLDPEPPTPDNPLLKFPNVVLTPHCAGITQETNWRLAMAVAKQIVKIIHGGEPDYCANPHVLAAKQKKAT